MFILFLIVFADEAERIIQCKGRVFCLEDEPGVHRVWLPNEECPGLAMSRAFGDYCVKDYGLISVPEVTQRHITSRDQFVVLATDGVSIMHYYNITIIFKLFLFIKIEENKSKIFIGLILQVWDVISNQEAIQIVSSTPNRAKSAKRLVECAVHAWKRRRKGIAMDDISAICLFFHSSPLSQQVHAVATPK